LVAVSGANEYKVKPLAFVSTVTPPIFAVFRAVAEAVADGEADGEAFGVVEAGAFDAGDEVLVDGEELPHAAAKTARPATPAAAHHLAFARFGGRWLTRFSRCSHDMASSARFDG
jgi:hypothetical protein